MISERTGVIQRRRSAGFTFVEMLLSIVLLGMLLAVAYGGMSAGTRSADRGEKYIELVNRTRVTHELLRLQLQRATPLPMVIDGVDSVVFEGESDRVRFVAPMPGYLGQGGAQIQEISFQRSEGGNGQVMVFNHHYWETSDQALDFAAVEAEPVVLLDRIRRASFRYMEAPSLDNEFPDWTDRWEETASIPWLVELEIEFEEEVPFSWPVLLVSPLIDGSGAADQDDWLAPYRQPGQRRTRQ